MIGRGTGDNEGPSYGAAPRGGGFGAVALPSHCRNRDRNRNRRKKVRVMTDSHLALDALPPLSWVPVEGEGSVDQSTQTLTLRSAGGVDWTNDATGGEQQHRAASLAFVAPPTPFMLSAEVFVDSEHTTFDAGALSI